MKKVLVFLLIVAVIVTGYLLKDKILDALFEGRTNEKLQEAQQVINKVAKEEKLKELEDQRIRNIAKREVIQGELHKTNELPVLENTAVWSNAIPKQGFISFCNNVMHVEIPYIYQFQYDTSKIQVLHIDNNTAYIQINTAKENFQPFISLQAQEIKQKRDSDSFLVVGFNSDDMANTLAVAEKDIEEVICTEGNYQIAIENLQDKITEVAESFGCNVQIVNE
jgi:hypothetical protein